MTLRVLLMSGSTRVASTNTAALRTAAVVAPPGVVAVVYDRIAELPAFTPDASDVDPHPAVAHLRQELNAADAVLFCTPEYAATLPGSFKNALDWTVGTSDLYEKPVAWLNVGQLGRGDGAIATLQVVFSYVGARVIEAACVRIPVGRDLVGADSLIASTPVRTQLTEVLTTMGEYLREV